ncbi:hypothetical protein FRC17_003618 [Serendipita sp. 399]|nr:hypothetical protein FRC17_003618 [Serendipita sp. 399]
MSAPLSLHALLQQLLYTICEYNSTLIDYDSPITRAPSRPDDFSYTLALGDSITAGAFSRGFQTNPFLSLSEWRGQSYAAGMDNGAITIPNFIKHYNPSATGGSRGSNIFPEICFGFICLPGSLGWNSAVDQLNAAQTGALASNLPHEVDDYLIPQVKKQNLPINKFKYINLQIGSNDLCWLCGQAELEIGPGSADDFEKNIRYTLERLRKEIPNSVVNLLAVFKVSDIFELTLNQPYCSKLLPSIPHKNLECACSLLGGHIGETTRALMDELTDQYNERLVKIATEYQKKKYPDFAVVWQPEVVHLGTYPIQALSDVDCFHPSLASHELLATSIWNRLVGTAEEKEAPVTWTTAPQVRCLQPGDRIRTDTLL